ncbi:MAG: hypothetical protein EPN98_05330 [Phenylobacterium sp.]|uniref:hypothetical protein n=1 Tax=Phenylobacterium sp. TaxID=1871053 RepID=UPI001224B705|nr:hypothetical protein [Phenylobacterium sp.]TAL36254.1 MAG: hypothetical protein EPN98_05330 [Phenylobacterium sp.]
MRLLIAATAALSVLGGSAALAQPYGYAGQQGFYDQQPYYGQRQPYRGQSYGRGSHGPPVQYGYGQPYGGNAYNGGSAYYGAQVYGYDNRSERHVRREHRRDRDRHYVAPRGGYDRHH